MTIKFSEAVDRDNRNCHNSGLPGPWNEGPVLGGKRTCLKLKRQIFFDMSKNDMSFLDKSY